MTNFFIVEDDPKLNDLYCRILTKLDHTILETIDNGEEAVRKYFEAEIKPDIIIIDHRMPNKTGIETIQEIKQIGTKTKFILATADQSLIDKKETLEKEIDVILFKPFSIKILINKIEELAKD